VQICLHSCCVIVLDVFSLLLFFILYILVVLAQFFFAITVLMDTCECKNSGLGALAL